MKKTTKILAAIVATTIITTGTISTYAMGNWQWQGQWMGKWNGQWQHSSQENKHSWNPSDMISKIATWTLSEQEKLDLAYQYSEEKVAYDAYNYFYTLYGQETFANIANSESEHMARVKVLLDRYSLPTPTTYWELQDEFDTLKLEWEKGLKEALEVGLKIEMLDIEDIKDTIKSTDNDDLKIVFTNIWWASYNHMRWFLKWLSNAGLTTKIDYSKYLSQEQVNSKWTLKHLLSENLASEWVILPSQASSKNIQANCKKDEANQKAREWYKNQIDKKHWEHLKSLSQDDLKKIDKKTDLTIEKVQDDMSLTEKIKEKTLNIYYALKDYLSGLFR